MKCVVCGKKAIKRYSPDLDIRGIGACKKHEERVILAYTALISGDEEMYKNLIEVEIL
jgi:hypothetical protein